LEPGKLDTVIAKALLTGTDCNTKCSECKYENGTDECMVLWRKYMEELTTDIKKQGEDLKCQTWINTFVV
jgi:hypothetical protein